MTNDLAKPLGDLIKLKRTADRFVFATGALQNLLAIAIGVGFVLSHIVGNSSTTASYNALEQIPAWPLSAGVLLVSLGVLTSLTDIYDSLGGARTACYLAQGIAWALYAALYVAGTISNGGLWGPQAWYVLAAVSAYMQAWYTRTLRSVGAGLGGE